ncbi:MAG: peptide-methionine (R)-S-oxide reductase [Actinomycetota bacterium]|nr:peptide-methionine (R)-S-oxide reductase [Actinomycetota bacterium]
MKTWKSTGRRDTRTGTAVVRSDEQWREVLTPQQYAVLREAGTERAGTGEYAYSTDSGMYRCAACGEQLFDSTAKYDSGTGWPSFTRPAHEQAGGAVAGPGRARRAGALRSRPPRPTSR